MRDFVVEERVQAVVRWWSAAPGVLVAGCPTQVPRGSVVADVVVVSMTAAPVLVEAVVMVEVKVNASAAQGTFEIIR